MEPLSLIPAVKSVIREIDPNQAFWQVTTLEQHFAANQEYAEPRFYTALLGAFGVLALLLASVGLYGVLSFMVSRRSREIGLRMALGAQRSTVLGQVMGDGLKLTALGLAIGVSAAVFSARALAELLYGISPTDTLTYVWRRGRSHARLVGSVLPSCTASHPGRSNDGPAARVTSPLSESESPAPLGCKCSPMTFSPGRNAPGSRHAGGRS